MLLQTANEISSLTFSYLRTYKVIGISMWKSIWLRTKTFVNNPGSHADICFLGSIRSLFVVGKPFHRSGCSFLDNSVFVLLSFGLISSFGHNEPIIMRHL